MTDRSICLSPAVVSARDVVLTVRFDPSVSPHLADIEVAGEEDLTSARLLEIVNAAAWRLAVFAADYQMAARLDCFAHERAAAPTQDRHVP